MDCTRAINWIFLLVIVNLDNEYNSRFVYSSETELKCLASKNEKWNKIKRLCVTCKNCPPGSFRNLTEPYNGRHGVHGDEQCIPCSPCPAGYFSENGQGDCSPCRTNCSEMYREYYSTCSSTQDAKCGSCLTNYEDTYGHILFPCSPRKDFRELDPPYVSNSGSNTDQKDFEEIEKVSDSTKHKTNTDHALLISVFVVFATVVLASVVLFIWRKFKNAEQNIRPAAEGAYSSVETCNRTEDTDPTESASFLNDDLEIDAEREDTIPKVHSIMLRRNGNVRPELEMTQQPCARPELSQGVSSLSQPNGLTLLLWDGSIVSLQIAKDFCLCREEQTCICDSNYFPNLQLEKSDKYIVRTASEICHDYLSLFRKLGLQPSVLYQETDSRDRAPEKITQKELFIRLLNKWIEKESTDATLKHLLIALCEAKFHRINEILIDMYNLERETLHPIHFV